MLHVHPATVRVLAGLLLVAVLGIGATAYVSSIGRVEDRAAVSHVRTAAAAAEAWFQDPFGGSGSFRRMTTAKLVHEAPSVSGKVHVRVLAGGAAFCLDEEAGAGHSAYFVGGAVGRLHELHGAATLAATLVHSRTTDAGAVCAALR